MRLVRSLVWQIVFLVVVGGLILHRWNAAGIAVPAAILIFGLLHAFVPKVDPQQEGIPLPPDRGPGELPGAPDRAVIPELIKARRARR